VANSNKSDSRKNSVSPGVRKHVQRLLAPVERFLAIEASSGIVLMIAAAIALAWANSPWRAAYADLWHIPIAFERDLHFWINDGLMTIFFFVVGLEIRREIHAGELSEIRRAALPLAAAVGGMLVPALIFLAMNAGRFSVRGWAIPMATDIAFAVGVLALLGKRVSPALRILLLALAVIDDVGAIAVIALFYSAEFSAPGFAVLGAGILLIVALQRLRVPRALAYVAPGIIVWTGAYFGGIHPTLAGVILGMLTPVKSFPGDREAAPPVERLQHLLHRSVAFGIMPLFAFANAGVPIGQISLGGDALWVFVGVLAGLTLGKPVGILALSWLAERSRAAALPRGVRWSHVSVVGMVGGIGFTMALFIASLAFPEGPLLETAKLAILSGSGLAAVISLLAGYALLEERGEREVAQTESEAEASTPL
jgi:NhaA family Na+:H+ antiporter